MPRINPARSTKVADNLAERITFERTERGWKQATLARKMTERGCPMTGSTVFKIESAMRGVTIDELVGFSQVFEVESTDLLLPMSLVLDRSALAVVLEVKDALNALAAAVHAMVEVKLKLVQLRRKNHEDEAIAERIQEWLPARMLSYPLATTHDDEDSAPDPVGNAWMALDKATSDYAIWAGEHGGDDF